ncbi:MAG TPA: DoxX family protein [Bryobacteraceae bacterium]|nr:DoxX family protein [Bryobacteraceae bacterium]
MFDTNLSEPRSAMGDWVLRGGIALLFVIFGAEKFPADPGSEWIRMFQQIGAGPWFRYSTGVVEVLGGILVLIPRTATTGLALLACTMAGAVLILIFVIGRPADSIFAGIFFIALSITGLVRWRQ